MEKNDDWDIEVGLGAASVVEAESELAAGSELEAEIGLPAGSGLEAEDQLEVGCADDPSVDCKAMIEDAIERAANDCGAPFETEVQHALLALRDRDSPEWMRVRARLKRANKDIPILQLDKSLDKLAKRLKEVASTHHGYAQDFLEHMSVGDHQPVSAMDCLFVPRAESQLWEPISFEELEKMVAQRYDCRENCIRYEDYKSIASHAMALAKNEKFFDSAPVGIACLRSFFCAHEGRVRREPLRLDHRQIEALDFEPEDRSIPLYDTFMHETFRSPVDGEEEEQRRLLEEFLGAAMLGIAPRYQKAFFWYDPYGRAGKGVLKDIFEALVPYNLRTAMPPTRWNDQYYMAGLAFKRLNAVGELPQGTLLPAAEFKSVLGGDRVMGRYPRGRPFMFKNEAAHLFTSNHFIALNEQSEALFERFQLVDFPNSRTKSGLPLDASLAERIIKSEMPGIAFKALLGAIRLLDQGRYSPSRVHERLMGKWRISSSSLDEFIHEECELHASFSVTRAGFYSAYMQWCKESGRKPVSKGRVKEMLEHNLKMGIRLGRLDGYDLFRGIRLKPERKDVAASNRSSMEAPVFLEGDADF